LRKKGGNANRNLAVDAFHKIRELIFEMATSLDTIHMIKVRSIHNRKTFI